MAVTQAEFSRMKGVSRKTVSEWKREGRIVIVDGMVDVERSQKKLLAASRHRAKGRRAAVTLPPADGAKVTPHCGTCRRPHAVNTFPAKTTAR